MTTRREGLAALASALFAIVTPPQGVGAQVPAKVVRVGYLTPTALTEREAVFRQELARLGYVEGRNLSIEYRNADGRFERLPELAADLVGLNVDVIVAVVTQAAVAAKGTKSTIPIVMVGVADPLSAGLVASLARPGGNITGNSAANLDVVGKQFELLREMLPGASRVAVLWNPTNTVFGAQQLKEANAAAARLGVELVVVEARLPDALEGAFDQLSAARPNALLIMSDPMFGTQTQRIGRLAIKHRLPAVAGFGNYADAGVLLAYGSNLEELHRRAAVYVDRILKGAKPADLPVERPTRFELVTNAKTAKALGVTIPPALASRADRVVR